MVSIIIWLAMGALVGWIASLIMKTNSQQGTILNIVVGIVGAALGGAAFRFFGANGANINNSNLTIYSFVVSIVGAVVLLAIVKAVRRVV